MDLLPLFYIILLSQQFCLKFEGGIRLVNGNPVFRPFVRLYNVGPSSIVETRPNGTGCDSPPHGHQRMEEPMRS